MASGVRQAAPRRGQSGESVDRAIRVWPVFALFPIIVAGTVKATGFRSIGGVDITLLSVAVLLVVTVLTLLRCPRYPFQRMLPFFVFSLVVLMGVARSDLGEYQALKARDYFLLTSVVALCTPALLRDLRDLRGLLAAWYSGGTLIASLAVIVGGAEGLYGREGIGEATLGPGYLSAIAFVVGCAALGEGLFPPAVALPGMAVSAFALWGIGSRGPLLAAFSGLVVWVLLRGLRRTSTLAVVALASGLALLAIHWAPEAALSRLVLKDAVRVELWSTAWAAFLDAPFLGLGWGDYATISFIDNYPHNLLLETAVELGIVGCLSLLGLMVVAVVRVWSSRVSPEARVLAAVAVVLLVGGQVSLELTSRLLWLGVIPCLLLPMPPALPSEPGPQNRALSTGGLVRPRVRDVPA